MEQQGGREERGEKTERGGYAPDTSAVRGVGALHPQKQTNKGRGGGEGWQRKEGDP